MPSVTETLVKVERALLSVSDKSGLVDFATGLAKLGVEMLASGGTYAALKDAGLAARNLQDDLNLPTSLSGRVKTLHSPIYAAILARRTDEHLAELSKMGVRPIDAVVCNFYPFASVAAGEASDERLVENIDIGGPTMVRAASKNFERVLVVPAPRFYAPVMDELNRNGGKTDLAFRKKLAVEAFSITASYDTAIFGKMRGVAGGFPERFVVSASKVQDARYGENPDQSAAVYSIDGWKAMSGWKQLAGETLSFNNFLDIGSAYDMVEGYDDSAAVATVKHGEISGFATAPTVAEAYSLAHACDPEADFGGTVVTNRDVDADAAKLIGKNEGKDDHSVYTEILMSPGFSSEAVSILASKQKKKIHLICTTSRPDYPYDVKMIEGSLLVQDSVDYRSRLDGAKASAVTRAKPSMEQMAKLLAAWEVVRKVRSNGIVIADGSFEGGGLRRFWTLGVASFRKRNGAVRIALENAGKRAAGSVCASDGFFPFRDSIDLLGSAGVTAVIQPGGSVSDRSVVEAADSYGMAMVMTHVRAFRH